MHLGWERRENARSGCLEKWGTSKTKDGEGANGTSLGYQ